MSDTSIEDIKVNRIVITQHLNERRLARTIWSCNHSKTLLHSGSNFLMNVLVQSSAILTISSPSSTETESPCDQASRTAIMLAFGARCASIFASSENLSSSSVSIRHLHSLDWLFFLAVVVRNHLKIAVIPFQNLLISQ